MSLLATINERLNTRGWQQKQLAFEWQAAVGAGEVSTYESRISKLLNAERDGFEFLADEKKGPDRRRGLAAALDLESEAFEQLFDRAVQAPTLIVHPWVEEPARRFLQQRAARPDAPFRIRSWNANGADAREAVRNAAAKAWRPIVVLPHERDRDFFQGAGLDTTLVETRDRGFTLSAAPELTAPMPAQLVDADGMPMVPDPDLEKYHRERLADLARNAGRYRQELSARDQRWAAVIRDADESCRPVTFRVDWLASVPAAEQLKTAILSWVVAQIEPSANVAVPPAAVGFLWVHKNGVVAIGPKPPRRALIEGHHPVRDVSAATSLVVRLLELAKKLNPYGQGGRLEIESEIDELERDVGVRVEISKDDLRAAVLPLHTAGTFVELSKARRDSAADEVFRTLIDDLLGRDMEVAPELVFELEACRHASLLHLDSSVGRTVIANTGAGNLVRLQLQEYADETASSVRLWKERGDYTCREPRFVVDGGNIRIRIERSVHRTLEGTVLAAPRRWRELQAANDGGFDDDDD